MSAADRLGSLNERADGLDRHGLGRRPLALSARAARGGDPDPVHRLFRRPLPCRGIVGPESICLASGQRPRAAALRADRRPVR